MKVPQHLTSTVVKARTCTSANIAGTDVILCQVALLLAGFILGCHTVGPRGEDRDRLFALLHLPPEGLPRLIAGHAGGVRALAEYQQDVIWAVGVEDCSCPE